MPMRVYNRNSPLFHQGDQVHKSVFIIFFQGDQLKNRVKKICEGSVLSVMKLKCFGANKLFKTNLCVGFTLIKSGEQKKDIGTECNRLDPKVSCFWKIIIAFLLSCLFAEQRAEEIILLESTAHCRANIYSYQI